MTWITIFDFAYLLALLAVLWRIQQWSARNAKSNQIIAKTLSETATKNAQAALISAQAAQSAISLLKEKIDGIQ